MAPRRENLARIAAKNNQILLPRIWLAILHNLSRFCIGFLVFLLRGAVESGRILLPRILARCIAMDGIVAPRSQFVDGRAQVQLRCGVVGCTWPVRERQHRRKKKKEQVLRWQFNSAQLLSPPTLHPFVSRRGFHSAQSLLCVSEHIRHRHAICDGIARFVSGRAARLGQLEFCVVAQALLLLLNQISVTQFARPKPCPPDGP